MEHSYKAFANKLAQAALAPGGEELIYLLQQAGMVGQGSAEPAAEAAPAHRVGIWERSGAAGSATFVRAADTRGEWSAWANVHRIQPKQAKRRVVLLGESVARGWGHAAAYAPASILQALLAHVFGNDEIEVVDLARMDMAFDVHDLALSAAKLEPDLVVIFAGNNWQPKLPITGEDLRDFEAALSRNGVAGFKKVCEEQLAAAARRAVVDVSTFYAAQNIPVVWIVPEWNLLDWHDGRINAPVRDGTANREWIARAQRADEALNREDYSEAAELARQMIHLDQGTVACGLRILAECKRHYGEVDEARRLLEAARDARIWNSSHLSAPRPYSVTQNAIREGARQMKCQVVDLPKVFAVHIDGLPDRRLFLDYCHLTAAGIRIAMAAAAACVSELLGAERVDSSSLLRAAPLADDRVNADAEFLAAVHSAHWWQGEEIVRYRCARAAALSPHIAEMMSAFIDLQTSPAPVQLSSAAAHLASLRQQPTQHYILRNSLQLLDPVLLESIADVLMEDRQGSVRRKVVRQWLERNDIAAEPANLLSFYYLSASALPQEVDWAWGVTQEVDPKRFTATDYYRAYWIKSSFAFLATCTGDTTLTVTLRLPNGSSPAAVVGFAVNGRVVASVEAGRGWKTVQIKVPAAVLRDGINRLLVSWPTQTEALAGRMAGAVRKLARGENDALLHVSGEIHLLTASANQAGRGIESSVEAAWTDREARRDTRAEA